MINSKKKIYNKNIFFSLQLSTKTWLKETCELIDYDCEILIPSNLNIKKSAYVYRDDNEIFALEENITNDNDKEKLMKINVYNNNKDIFFEFERNKFELDETDNIITPNTSWFLLKPTRMDPKMNRYKISPGEIIKIGRITMRIRDIKLTDKIKNKNNNINNTSLNESDMVNSNIQALKTEGIQNNSLYNIKIENNKNNKNKELDTKLEASEKIINITKKKDLKKNYNIFSKVEKKNNVCRICYIEEEDSEKDPLLQPCICDGSLKYIHLSCLRHWISTHSCVKLDANENCAIFLIKPVECELCKTKFPDIIKYQNKLYHLLDFSNEYKNYLTLESLTLDKNKNKFIYVVSLEKNKNIKVGRGHECEIILSDISVSRIHCYLVVEKKNIFLEDNDSKFGTLVFVQTPKIKITQELPLYLQIGRTSFEFNIKKNFKLFSCCNIDEKKNLYFYYNQNEKYIKDNNRLVVKEDENENGDVDYFYKNNNSQIINDNNKFNTNSINIKERDKMSDNEYLLIKHNKKNKNLKKNIFYEESVEKEDNQNMNDNNNENKKDNNNNNDEIKTESLKSEENNSCTSSINRDENENINNNNNEDENVIESNNNEEEIENESNNVTTESRKNLNSTL